MHISWAILYIWQESSFPHHMWDASSVEFPCLSWIQAYLFHLPTIHSLKCGVIKDFNLKYYSEMYFLAALAWVFTKSLSQNSLPGSFCECAQPMIPVLNGALWDMEQQHYGICEIGLLIEQCRDHFINAPSQIETTLHCNVVSHWLGPFTKRSGQWVLGQGFSKHPCQSC